MFTSDKVLVILLLCIYGYLLFDFDLIHEQFFCSKLRAVEEILTIEIKPGWKKGTKITFPEKGNQELGFFPADLIFVVDMS